jgi:arabinan endo-1,5-alpha-L-arabinosidase
MRRLLAFIIIAAAIATRGANTSFVPMNLEGQTFIHDPSTIIKEQDRYYVFGTRPGINVKSSPDLIHWTNEAPVFARTLERERAVAPGFDGSIWAPDIIRVDGMYYLYYSVSSWGKQTSAIELATNVTLNPGSKQFRWHDAGEVIHSTNGYDFNTIDPSVFWDNDGKLWLSFGSYWHGIYLVELDPKTGLRLNTNAPQHLAWNNSIEASCLTRHDKFYYLFVNWGQCCKGTNSTYEVRVGRAEKVTGPYLDQKGFDLATGGGTPFLLSSGRFIGPGHIGIVNDGSTNGATLFSYHYYDAETRGRSRLAIGKIDWSSGWPVPVN